MYRIHSCREYNKHYNENVLVNSWYICITNNKLACLLYRRYTNRWLRDQLGITICPHSSTTNTKLLDRPSNGPKKGLSVWVYLELREVLYVQSPGKVGNYTHRLLTLFSRKWRRVKKLNSWYTALCTVHNEITSVLRNWAVLRNSHAIH